MEQPIVQATVIVLKYSLSTGQWEELGSQKGTCVISIFKSPSNEYRFVSWKESSQEVVLNSFLFPTMNYNETTPTFHQWYDESKSAYGLNFTDPNEAKKFGIAVVSALEILNSPKVPKPMSMDNVSVSKKVEKSPGYRTAKKMSSVDRPPASSTVSPYATTGINQMNDSSAAKPPVVAVNKPSGSAAPPPPGPPPSAPAPPGPPPSGPPPLTSAPVAPTASVKKPANDFASQLLAASQNMKSSSANSNSENPSAGMSTNMGVTAHAAPSKPAPTTSAAPVDFLTELRMKSQKRTDSTNQNKKAELPKTTTTTQPPTAPNVTTKISVNQSSKMSSSNSDLASTSYVTSADLDKFRTDLMQDFLFNMDKMKNEIISSIISKLN